MSRTKIIPHILGFVVLATCVCPTRGESLPLIGAGAPDELALSVVYSVETGWVSVLAPEGAPLTAIQLTSASGQFTSQCEL